MDQVEFVVKVIEPTKEYMKYFVEETLENCKRDCQQYLWSCPEGTQYIYVATRYKKRDAV